MDWIIEDSLPSFPISKNSRKVDCYNCNYKGRLSFYWESVCPNGHIYEGFKPYISGLIGKLKSYEVEICPNCSAIH